MAYGQPHIKEYARLMLNSLKKFHPDIPHFMVSDAEVEPILKAHELNRHRLYPIIGTQLSKEYEMVINIDNDCIVTGSLKHILEDKTFDVGGVLNNNLIDPQLTVWDVPPEYYINAGFIAIRGEKPWQWWLDLCVKPWFMKYRFIEQDQLNIMFHYGNLRTKIFDYSKFWHGLIHKGQWHKFIMGEDQKIILPKTEGVCAEDKEIKIIHFAGGNVPKMNVWPYFQEPVAKRLTFLMEDNK